MGYDDEHAGATSDHAGVLQNRSRTCARRDTPLTQRRSPSGLLAARNRMGAESFRGRLLSNLAEQGPWLNDPDPRPWATHPMQTVRGLMKWQLDLLAR
jgi:hypothetical protein